MYRIGGNLGSHGASHGGDDAHGETGYAGNARGKTIEAIKDGAFAESDARSAPYFNLRIDGITELS